MEATEMKYIIGDIIPPDVVIGLWLLWLDVAEPEDMLL